MREVRLGLRANILLAASILIGILLIGSATGVQRTIVSIYAKGFVESALLAFLPVVVFGLFKGTVDLVGGILSDKTGRRLTMLLGTLLYLFGTLSIVFFRSLEGVILGNTLIGFGQGMTFAAAMIALSDISGSSEAATSFGFMEAFVYGGYGAGAILAGFLWSRYGIVTPFVYSIAATIAALTIVATLVRETKHMIAAERRAQREEGELPTLVAFKSALKSPSLPVTFFSAHVAKFTDALAWAAFPLLFQAKGYTDIEIGVLQGVITFLWALSMPFFGRLSDRVGRKPLILTGLVAKGLGIILLLFSRNFTESLAASVVIGLSYGLYYPILPAVAVDTAPLTIKGRILGLYRSIRDYGYFTGALLIGYATDAYGFGFAFYLTAALVFAAAALVATVVRETRPVWPFFGEVLAHVDVLKQAARVNLEVIEMLREGNVEKAYEAKRELRELEHKADRIKREIMSKIWSSHLPFGDRIDFERLVETLDLIAGCYLQSTEKLLRAGLDSLPEEMSTMLEELSRALVEAIDTFYENLEALKLAPSYAIKVAEDVRRAESRVDRITEKLVDSLEKLGREGKIDCVSLMLLKDAIDLLEYVADDLEDASDIVTIISYKHM